MLENTLYQIKYKINLLNFTPLIWFYRFKTIKYNDVKLNERCLIAIKLPNKTLDESQIVTFYTTMLLSFLLFSLHLQAKMKGKVTIRKRKKRSTKLDIVWFIKVPTENYYKSLLIVDDGTWSIKWKTFSWH